MTRKIIIEFVNPAIPIRAFDYLATWADFEPGDPCGYGDSPEAARADFNDALQFINDERHQQ